MSYLLKSLDKMTEIAPIESQGVKKSKVAHTYFKNRYGKV